MLPLGHGGSPQYWVLRVDGEETFFSNRFQTAETGERTLNSGVKGSGANHYPRAPPSSSAAKPCGYKTDEQVLYTQGLDTPCWIETSLAIVASHD